jgi:hypothetical protein
MTVDVKSSPFIDIKVTSFKKKFEQIRRFDATEFTALLPDAVPASTIDISEKLGRAADYLTQV